MVDDIRKPRVLFVEDHRDVRELFVHCMRAAGWQVEAIDDGHDAVDVAARLQPDVVVMDLQLPVVSGVEATRRLKADPRTAHLRVIACTAFGRQHEAELREGGFLLVVPKPCEPEDLRVILEGLAAGWEP
jgi:CheY-like chemotaxis protein